MIRARVHGLDKAVRGLKKLEKELGRNAIIAAAREEAEEASQFVYNKIAGGQLRVRQNRRSTIEKKGSNVPLIDTESYAESWEGSINMGSRGNVILSVQPMGENASGLSNAALASILDSGTRNMVARRHLEKIRTMIRRRLIARLEDKVRDVLGS